MQYKFKNKIWIWGGGEKGNWHFITVPPEIAGEVSKKFSKQRRGWGSYRIKATLKTVFGKSDLETSIFPNKRDLTFILPVKKTVRSAIGAQDGDVVEVAFKIQKNVG